MKKAIFILTSIILSFCLNQVKADDTAALKAMLGADVTLPAGHGTYTFSSGLNLTHSFNANGNELRYTGTTGYAITLSAPDIKFYNGKLTGNSITYNSSGSNGINMTAARDTVANMRVWNFNYVGILGGNADSHAILNCNIKSGYVAAFMISNNTKSIQGGTVAFDTLDRTSLSASTVTQPALVIRGGVTFPSSNWNVHHNILAMPFNPVDWTSEGTEVRYAPYSNIWANTCKNGSIGISIVKSDFVIVNFNIVTGQNAEGIEFADSKNGWCANNTIKGTSRHGILVDGFAGFGNFGHKFLNNTILNCPQNGIELYGVTSNIDIINCNISNCGKPIYLQTAFNVNVYSCVLDGVNNSNIAIVVDASKGYLNVTGTTFKNFTNRALQIYNHPPTGQTIKTDNLIFSGNIYNNTTTGYIQDLGTGGSVGTNISIH